MNLFKLRLILGLGMKARKYCVYTTVFFLLLLLFFNSARMHKLDQKEHLTHLKQVK